MFEIHTYRTETGQVIFQDWLRKLRDTAATVAIIRRINRVEQGNFGDHKPCRDGVWELRVDTGPGYRLYYSLTGKTVVLLLCAGDKRSQDSDVAKACEYWNDWKRRALTKDDSK